MSKWEKVGAAVFGFIAVFVISWLVGEHFGLDKNSWPAWVQAIGSIGAIVGSFEVGRRQARATEEQAARAVKRAIDERNSAIKAMVIHAKDEAASVEKNARTMPAFAFVGTLKFNPYTFSETAAAFAIVPLHELGSYQAVSSLAGLQSSLKRVASTGERIAASAIAGTKILSNEPLQGNDASEMLTACKMARYHADRYLKIVG
jgi:hypothetical protein